MERGSIMANIFCTFAQDIELPVEFDAPLTWISKTQEAEKLTIKFEADIELERDRYGSISPFIDASLKLVDAKNKVKYRANLKKDALCGIESLMLSAYDSDVMVENYTIKNTPEGTVVAFREMVK
jgi:hypothetical protein